MAEPTQSVNAATVAPFYSPGSGQFVVLGAQQSDSGEVFVPPATESYTYDTDGNLATDGRWAYSWDGENRLVEMKRDTSVPTLSSRLRLVFEYAHQGRRIRKQFFTWSSGWASRVQNAGRSSDERRGLRESG